MRYRGRHVRLRRSKRWPWLVVPALALGMAGSSTAEFSTVTANPMMSLPVVSTEHEASWRHPPVAVVVKAKPRKVAVKARPVTKIRAKIHRVDSSYAKRMMVLRKARSMLGIPYVYGGTSFGGIDCSGFTLRAYAVAGLRLPRTSFMQHFRGRRVRHPLPGDLVWWGPWTGRHHVAIYYGGGQVIGARHRGVASTISRLYGFPRFYRMFA